MTYKPEYVEVLVLNSDGFRRFLNIDKIVCVSIDVECPDKGWPVFVRMLDGEGYKYWYKEKSEAEALVKRLTGIDKV